MVRKSLMTENKKSIIIICLIFILALVIRLSYWAEYRNTALDDWHLWDQSDMATYVEQARQLVEYDWLASEPYHPYHKWQYVAPESDWDNWYGAHVFHQAPAYSYIIAFFTLVITNPFDVIKTVQLFFGSLSCIFIFLLTRHIAGMFAATIAGVLSAIYAPAFYLEAQILREGLAVFFMLLILFLMIKSLSSKLNNYSISIYSLVLGLSLGMFLMLHQIGLVLMSATLFILIGLKLTGYRKIHHKIGLIIVGFTLGFSPWMLRNIEVDAPIFSVSSRMPIVFVQSNEATAPYGGAYFTDLTKTAAEILNNASNNNESVIYGVWKSYKGDVKQIFVNWFKRFKSIWIRYELADNTSIYFFNEMTRFLQYMPGFGFIFPLGIAGIFSVLYIIVNNQKNDNKKRLNFIGDVTNANQISYKIGCLSCEHVVLMFFLFSIIMSLSLTHGLGRLRIYIIPFFIIYAGIFIELLYKYYKAKQHFPILAMSVLAILAVLFQSYCSSDYRLGLPRPSDFLVAFDLSIKTGDLETAGKVVESGSKYFPQLNYHSGDIQQNRLNP